MVDCCRVSRLSNANHGRSAQYSAWCANNGNYRTDKRNADWNAEIIWKMRLELAFAWDLVTDEVEAVFSTLLAAIEAQFDALKDALAAAPMTQEVRHQLLGAIRPRFDGCKYAATRAKEEFAHEVT